MNDEDETEKQQEHSPCIGVCTLDEDGEYCTACGQSLEELTR